MVGRGTLIAKVKETASVLLLIVLALALGSCGSEGTSSGEDETTSAETEGEELTTAGAETTSAKVDRGGVPADLISVTLNFIPSESFSVGGTAVITDTSGGLEVRLNMQNLSDQPGVRHLAHIHQGGGCADEQTGNSAPVLYSLEPVISAEGGTGSSTTTIPDVTVVQLFSGAPKYVDVHAEATGNEVPPAVACADIYTTTGGD